MTLSEDARGLRVTADLDPNDPDVRSLVPKMRRRDVSEMSFAFRVTDQTWSEDRSLRTIRGVALHKGDVSIVTYGSNDATSAELVARRAAASARRPMPDYTTRAAERLVLLRAGSTSSRSSAGGPRDLDYYRTRVEQLRRGA